LAWPAARVTIVGPDPKRARWTEEADVAVVPVIFEDETVTGFRPLSWSQPVGELRCGLLNCRERLALLTGGPPVQLCRTFLQDLAAAQGQQVGIAPLETAVAAGARLLLVNGRLGRRWDLLSELVRSAAGDDLAWRDDDGWLAFSVAGEAARALLASWSAWQETAAHAGCWQRGDLAPAPWQPPATVAPRFVTGVWRRIWQLVPDTADAIRDDLARLAGGLPQRLSWGAIPADPQTAAWAEPVALAPWHAAPQPGVMVRGENPLYVGPGCDLAPGVAVDTRGGPVILGSRVCIQPHVFLEGPLYIGSDSLVKANSTIYGETSLGAVNKVAGEIGESTFLDFTNKQHEGFIGHAYLGSWCNLGALTTCSDLKNTYGTIRVDLGAGAEESGQRFIGLLMGEHGKTAIGTLLNTATTVGFASNVFATGFPAKFMPCYTWGDGRATLRQDPERALATARTVMARRGCVLTPGHEAVFRFLAA
jgi:UDP-N-acetylglucosamine diphosphorylase/glucosamine-1-phosphate N-acetyltransferase